MQFRRHIALRLVSLLSALLFWSLPAKADIPASVSAAWQRFDDMQLLLNNREFAQLDAYYSALVEAFDVGVVDEEQMLQAVDLLTIPNPENEIHIEAWMANSGSRYATQLVAGRYYQSLGHTWRGNAFANRTGRFRLEALDRYLSLANRCFRAALPLSKRPVHAYRALLSLARYSGRRDEAPVLLQEAQKIAPKSLAIRSAYFATLSPLWGGSDAAQRGYIAQVRKEGLEKLAHNLEAIMLAEAANAAWSAKDRVKANELFRQSIVIDPTARTISSHAGLLRQLGRDGDALALLHRALDREPNHPEILHGLALANLRRNNFSDGLQFLRAAAARWELSAMSQLAGSYSEGTYGVAVNALTAIQLMERAGHFQWPDGMLWLGQSYAKGLGIKADHARAFKYYQSAESQGSLEAANELGLAYWYGHGTSADPAKAAALWLTVARGGFWQGAHNLHFFLTLQDRLQLLVAHPQDFHILLFGQSDPKARGGVP